VGDRIESGEKNTLLAAKKIQLINSKNESL
jgi:hypothetical protein